jgi:hypothetical protein
MTCETRRHRGSSGSPATTSHPREPPPARQRGLHHRGEAAIRSAEAAAALSREGRYQAVTAALRVKEVRVSDDERFIICHAPGRAVRDAAARARTLALLKELIKYTDTLSKDKRAEACAAIAARPGLNRYLRITPGGRLRIHAKSVKAEENLDGKYLLRASAPDVAAVDIAMAHSRLLETERGWRAMHQATGLRQACDRGEEHIRAHLLLCWLALLLARIAENACHGAWPALRCELDRIAIGTFTGPAGTFRQSTEITDACTTSSSGSASTRRPGCTREQANYRAKDRELGDLVS